MYCMYVELCVIMVNGHGVCVYVVVRSGPNLGESSEWPHTPLPPSFLPSFAWLMRSIQPLLASLFDAFFSAFFPILRAKSKDVVRKEEGGCICA